MGLFTPTQAPEKQKSTQICLFTVMHVQKGTLIFTLFWYHIFLELLFHGLTEPDKDEDKPERLLTAISQLLSSVSVPWLIHLPLTAPLNAVKCLPSLPARSLHQLQHESLYPVAGRF